MDRPPPLDQLDPGRLSVFLDFDGTLVDIAPAPDKISPRHDLADRLLSLLETLDGRLAIVSGRSIADLQHYLGSGLPLVGSHGSELLVDSVSTRGDGVAIAPLHAGLMEVQRHFPGTQVELKPFGGAIHFRSNPAVCEDVRTALIKLIGKHDLRLQEGKMVLEIVPAAASKGQALQTLMQRAPYTRSRPIFVGDDLTDEEGFRVARELGGFGVIVGEERETEARYHLASVSKVHEWMGF